MAYKVIRSAAVDQDLRLIFRHLVDSYHALGEALPDAIQRAAQRIDDMKTDMRSFRQTPHQGTRLPDLGPGLRRVTKKRAVFYFIVNDEAQTVRIAAVFFGGQDHGSHIQARLVRM